MPKAAIHSIPVSSSPLHNLSSGDIADELGALKAEMADLKAREDTLKAELVARGVSEAEGALFRATLSEAVRWTLAGISDPAAWRKAQSLLDRYNEEVEVGNDTNIKYSKLYTTSFNSSPGYAGMLASDAEGTWMKDHGVIFDKSTIREKGEMRYLLGRSDSRICMVLRSYFGNSTLGRPGAFGNQELRVTACRPSSVAEAAFEDDVFAILDRLRFDGGEINRSRAASQ